MAAPQRSLWVRFRAAQRRRVGVGSKQRARYGARNREPGWRQGGQWWAVGVGVVYANACARAEGVCGAAGPRPREGDAMATVPMPTRRVRYGVQAG